MLSFASHKLMLIEERIFGIVRDPERDFVAKVVWLPDDLRNCIDEFAVLHVF